MFQPFSYALLFLAIVACNHKFGKPYEEARAQKEQRRARRKARYEKNRAEEKKAFEEAQEKRREARKKRKQEEERLEELYRNRRHAYEVPATDPIKAVMAPNAKTVARQKRKEREAKVKKKIAKNTARIRRQKDRAEEAGLPPGSRLRQPPLKRKAGEENVLASDTTSNYAKAHALKAVMHADKQNASGVHSRVPTDSEPDSAVDALDDLERGEIEGPSPKQGKRKRHDSFSADECGAPKKAKHESPTWSFQSLLAEENEGKERKASGDDREHEHAKTKDDRLGSHQGFAVTETQAPEEMTCTMISNNGGGEQMAGVDNKSPLLGANHQVDRPVKARQATKKGVGTVKHAARLEKVRNPDEIRLRTSRRPYSYSRHISERGTFIVPGNTLEWDELWQVNDDEDA
ncbi:hypothetical protein LTR85_006964 [Meristemomyces frigidus]|nr:hypothetical protein LTR85_006964 [Meristemomyces frigidus]